MTGQTLLEGLGIVATAVAMVAIGHFLTEPILTQWAGVVFGAGVGYLSHGVRAGN